MAPPRWSNRFHILALLGIPLLTQEAVGQSHSAPVSNDTITDCRSWLPWVEGDKSGNETYTTKSQIDSLLQCPEVVKTIEIRVPAGQTVLDLTGIVRFDQGLRILDGADLIYINAEQLEEVGNVFHLGGLPSLRVLNLPKLQSVGLLRLEDLPMLWNVTDPWVTSGLNITLEKPLLAEDYAIKVKNTSLSELVFRALSSQTNEGVIEINNNALLSSIWIQGWINGPDRVNISSNNQQLVVGFPDVQNLGTSFYISQASALHMPTVTSSTGSVILKYNYFTSLELPLITVSNELGITANNRLTKLDISQLRSLGVLSGNSQGILRIQDNGDLKTITLPANDLYANQAIWLQGYFTELSAEAFASLRFGDFGSRLDIRSYDRRFNCTPIDLVARRIWGWKDNSLPPDYMYSCIVYDAFGNEVSRSRESTAGEDSEGKKPLARHIIAIIAACSCLGGLILFYVCVRLRRRRKAKKEAARAQVAAADSDIEWMEMTNGERIARRRSRDHAVVRESEDGVERPPNYARIGKPGEVPPQYLEVISSHASSSDVDNAATGTAITPISTPTPAPATTITDTDSPVTNATSAQTSHTDAQPRTSNRA